LVWSGIKQKAWQLKGLLTIASSIAGLVVLGGFTSAYQTLELSTLDLWFRLRPQEERDSRIVVVNIGESDLRELKEWPISDGKLANLLENIAQQQPRVIGLDLYRDLPQGDLAGQKRLAKFLATTPNIIGVEKAIGEKVFAPSILQASEQIAMADLVVDADAKVRRGLISTKTADDRVLLGLATKLSLIYLAQEKITLQAVENSSDRILGKAVFSPLKHNEGAYVNADVGGYQVLLNFRGVEDKFVRTSLTEVLNQQIPQDLFKDKIILIGSTAPSLNDLFYTPYSSKSNSGEQMPGVYVHANLTSHILSAALENRLMIQGISEIGEWGWVIVWSFVGATISLVLLEVDLLQKNAFSSVKWTAIGIFIPVGFLFGSNYLFFLWGWWLPVISPLLALSLSAITIAGYYNQSQKNLAFTDGLTQIANRRFFDRYLEQQWWRSQKYNQDIALILCDVDFFKLYNDTYGHQGGDECLRKVARAIKEAVRANDLPARYGGEEFVIILPNTDAQTAMLVANRIRFKLQEMEIPHISSKASSYVSISCGISSLKMNNVTSPEELIAIADRALYLAKEQGRDCAVIAD
jgi:adenylate cyclase